MTGYSLTLSEAEIGRYRMMAEAARRQEAEQWRAAGIVPGAKVADVGCGPGAVLVAMAEVVGESGEVTGVDADEAAVTAATAMIAQSGWSNARVHVGQADDTGLDPATYDVVVMRHVLAHNGPTEQRIVDHLATLLRPGGCLYLVDIDGTAIRLFPSEPDLDDLMDRYVAFHNARGNDLLIGLRLARLMTTAGLEMVEHRGFYNIVNAPPGMRPPAWAAREAMVDAGIATDSDVSRWDAAFTRMDAAADRPTLFAPLFSAIGRRPETDSAE
ncbi:MAG: methyltransferase domain-containing protein [Actinomycetota bacterium]